MHKLFKVLGSEQRLKILNHLLTVEEPICYCELEDVINRDRSVIYRHLKKLESVELLKTRRAGKRVECWVDGKDKVKKLLDIADSITKKEVNTVES